MQLSTQPSHIPPTYEEQITFFKRQVKYLEEKHFEYSLRKNPELVAACEREIERLTEFLNRARERQRRVRAKVWWKRAFAS